jgi:hypothetical protein
MRDRFASTRRAPREARGNLGYSRLCRLASLSACDCYPALYLRSASAPFDREVFSQEPRRLRSARRAAPKGRRRQLPIYFPPSFSAASECCLGRFTHLCLRRNPARLTPQASVRRTNVVRFALNAFADYQLAIPWQHRRIVWQHWQIILKSGDEKEISPIVRMRVPYPRDPVVGPPAIVLTIEITYSDVFDYMHVSEFTFFKSGSSFDAIAGKKYNRSKSEKLPEGIEWTPAWSKKQR